MRDKFSGRSIYRNGSEVIAVIWMFWRVSVGWFKE